MDPGTRPLLTELHLKDSIIDGLARNLPSKFVKLPLRNLEVSRRVFVLKTVTEGQRLSLRECGMNMNLGVLLPRNNGGNGGDRGRFLSLGSNSSRVEQVTRALLGSFLSGNDVRGLVLLLGNGRTEFVRYPIERIVERDSRHRETSVNDLKRLIFTHPLRGTHCTLDGEATG